MRVTHARAALLGSIAAAAFITSPARAQDAAQQPSTAAPDTSAQTQDQASTASDQEIVVTARRRSELLLNVPVAVTAYSGEQLSRQGALDITDISDTTPNVNFETSRGTNTTLTAFIRGVGQQDPVAGFEQGVGLYVDDVYMNRPQANLLDIYDVERIEVLRGPQGTLYGRNTIGGAIKYVTRRIPTDGPHASLRANVGTYRQVDLVGTASAPLAGGLRLGAAVGRFTRRGFGENLTTGAENYNKDIWAARGTIEFQPSDNIFFRLSGDKTWDDSNPRGGHRLIPGLLSGTPVLDDVFDSQGALNDPKQKVRAWGIAFQGEIGLADENAPLPILVLEIDGEIGDLPRGLGAVLGQHDQRILDAEARQVRGVAAACAFEHLRDGPRHVKHLSAGHRLHPPFGDRGLGGGWRRGLVSVAIGGQQAANGRLALGHGRPGELKR